MSKRFTYRQSFETLDVVDQTTGHISKIFHTDTRRIVSIREEQSPIAARRQERRNERDRAKRRAATELDRLRKAEPWRPESYWQQSSTDED